MNRFLKTFVIRFDIAITSAYMKYTIFPKDNRTDDSVLFFTFSECNCNLNLICIYLKEI